MRDEAVEGVQVRFPRFFLLPEELRWQEAEAEEKIVLRRGLVDLRLPLGELRRRVRLREKSIPQPHVFVLQIVVVCNCFFHEDRGREPQLGVFPAEAGAGPGVAEDGLRQPPLRGQRLRRFVVEHLRLEFLEDLSPLAPQIRKRVRVRAFELVPGNQVLLDLLLNLRVVWLRFLEGLASQVAVDQVHAENGLLEVWVDFAVGPREGAALRVHGCRLEALLEGKILDDPRLISGFGVQDAYIDLFPGFVFEFFQGGVFFAGR